MIGIDAAIMQRQAEGMQNASDTCLLKYGPESLLGTTKSFFDKKLGTLMCPAYFDSILCWPPTPSNSTAILSCPYYVIGFEEMSNQSATRKCLHNGTWFRNEEGTYWTNYSRCFVSDESLVPVELDHNSTIQKLQRYLPAIKIISRTGYTVSLLTLVVAFIIMISIKKLHCQRNRLHMHLFVSFILRAFISLLKDMIFINGIGLTSDIAYKDGKPYFLEDKESGNWVCKLVISLFQFFITANYSWIFMEGLYLHNLIFCNMFAESSGSIALYIVLGWGMPTVVIIAWVTVRILYEDTLCWTTHKGSKMTLLTVRVPTAISIVLNLILFIRIASVIFSKLQAPVYEEARRYQKWARSTLVLAPLLGVHYALLIVMSTWMDKNETIELTWLFADQLFASFQGFFVAILYCFLNSEVRCELKVYFHSVLVYIAEHSCLKYCFPCRQRYLRSARARTSVCTTMSCSSLFNNGINPHRNSRTLLPHERNKSLNERIRDGRPNAVSWQDRLNTRSGTDNLKKTKYNFNSNGSISDERTTSFVEKVTSRSEPQILSEKLSMLPRSAA